jgi:hypothetical protein
MDPAEDRLRASPQHLVRLLEVGGSTTQDWRPEEFREILRHQLSAPVWLDVPWTNPGAPEPSAPTGEAEIAGREIGSFDELFHHPAPPLGLLRLTKDFAKSNWNHPQSTLPGEIAALLYYESIVAAWIHGGEHISQLSDDELRKGVEWVLSQNWVDDSTRELFVEALACLGGPSPHANGRSEAR